MKRVNYIWMDYYNYISLYNRYTYRILIPNKICHIILLAAMRQHIYLL